MRILLCWEMRALRVRGREHTKLQVSDTWLCCHRLTDSCPTAFGTPFLLKRKADVIVVKET